MDTRARPPHMLGRMAAALFTWLYRHGKMAHDTAYGLYQQYYLAHRGALNPHGLFEFHKWGKRFEEVGHVADAHRSGRPPSMSKAEAQQLAAVFMAGTTYDSPYYAQAPVQRFFTSIQDGIQNSEELRAAITRHHITADTLLRAMRQAEPRLQKRRVDVKMGFDGNQMAARMADAGVLERLPDEVLFGTIFIDEATITVHPSDLRCGATVNSGEEACTPFPLPLLSRA